MSGKIPPPVTLKDVAAAAEVDIATVSRVATGRTGGGRVSEARAEHVRRVIERLGYRPNAASRAIRGGRFKAVGLLSSLHPGTGISSGITHGLLEALSSQDYHLVMSNVSDADITAAAGLPRLIREWAVDALLVNYAHSYPAELVDAVDKLRMPALWLNAKLPSRCIYPDDFGAARSATEHLLSLGHRRILYQGPTFGDVELKHYSFLDRFEGYAAAMTDAGLQPAECYSAHSNEARRELGARFRSDDRPTAVVSATRAGALELVAALDVGLRVPEELSIIALRDPSILGSWDPGIWVLGVDITAKEIPVYEIGRRAAQMMLEGIEAQRLNQASISVPFEDHAGSTVAPPP